MKVLVAKSPARLPSPWNSPSQNAGVGCHALLQGHLPNSGMEPEPPVLQVDFLPPEPPGKPHCAEAILVTRIVQDCLKDEYEKEI